MPNDHLKAKSPRRITVGVFLDEVPADLLDSALLERQEAQAAGASEDELAEIDAKIQAAQAGLDAATQWFTFQAIGNRAFARLVAEHPPTEAQLAEAEAAGLEKPGFDGNSFPPALIAASCIAPPLSLGEAYSLYQDESGWNVEELAGLFAAAFAVNTRARPLRVRPET